MKWTCLKGDVTNVKLTLAVIFSQTSSNPWNIIYDCEQFRPPWHINTRDQRFFLYKYVVPWTGSIVPYLKCCNFVRKLVQFLFISLLVAVRKREQQIKKKKNHKITHFLIELLSSILKTCFRLCVEFECVSYILPLKKKLLFLLILIAIWKVCEKWEERVRNGVFFCRPRNIWFDLTLGIITQLVWY